MPVKTVITLVKGNCVEEVIYWLNNIFSILILSFGIKIELETFDWFGSKIREYDQRCVFQYQGENRGYEALKKVT